MLIIIAIEMKLKVLLLLGVLNKPLIIGHRGYPKKFPENTILSFIAALYYGADGVELDVRCTSDGSIVVIHDENTGRVGDKNVRVKESTVEVLRKVYLGLGQVIPTLEEALTVLPREKLVIIEVKDVDISAEVFRVARKHRGINNTIFASFYEEALAEIRSLSEDALLGLNVWSLEQARRALVLANKLNLFSINPPIHYINLLGFEGFTNYLKSIKSINRKVFLWVVNDLGEIGELVNYCDAIVTDDVETIVKQLKKTY